MSAMIASHGRRRLLVAPKWSNSGAPSARIFGVGVPWMVGLNCGFWFDCVLWRVVRCAGAVCGGHVGVAAPT